MESTRWENVQDLFHQAAELPEADRQPYLHSACGGDAAMMAEVLAMLRADGGGDSLLDGGLPAMAHNIISSADEAVSVREIGPYRLVSVLGEGGMGVVWLAQREDTDTLVAIKFLPHASLSPARRERFTHEIKTLGKLTHPYIARLYDAGTLADGTPWFVMEYVKGERLTEHARQGERPVDERLRLFRKVCEAVQYAHSQEIIHRDLKPSNILVEQDGTPRLLDFGIARELQGLTEPSERTRPGLRFMSPHYAAPEWVRDGTVGFFTDVYSLGVILYEMLSGGLPFEGAKPATAEHEGEKSRAHPKRPSIAAGADSSIGKAAWSDLDVLCLKAMHSDANQRYQSVEALVRDLDHYFRSEPLEARPDSLSYRASKFVKRNRRPVLAASLTLATVIGLVIFFTVHLTRARNAAVAEAARTRRIQAFMTSLFGSEDSDAGPSQDLRVVTLLERGVKEARALNTDPQVQAELYRTLASSYEPMGKYAEAEALIESALRQDRVAPHPNDLAIAEDLQAKALNHSDQGKTKEAEALARESLAMVEKHRPADEGRLATAQVVLGRVLTDSGDYKQAVEVLQKAVPLEAKLDPSSRELSDTLSLLANAELYLGHYEIADSLNRRALELDRKIYGEKHPSIASDLINLGQLQEAWGRYAQAEQYDRQALEITKAWYGMDHPDTARQSAILAQTLIYQKRYDEAEPLLRGALDTEKHFFAENDTHLAYISNALGNVQTNRGELDAAEESFRKTIAIYRAALGDGDYRVGVGLSNLANVHLEKKDYPEAERIGMEALQLFQKVLPPDNINIGNVQIRLGRAFLRQKRFQEAESHTLAGYEILARQTDPHTLTMQRARQDLVAIYTALNQTDKAKPYAAELPTINAGTATVTAVR